MIVRGPILNPRDDGTVDWIPDGVIAGDARIRFVGTFEAFRKQLMPTEVGPPVIQARGIITPPFLDAHIHIPQHPIRGHFTDGVIGDPPEGRLLAGLNRNVFPAEGKCADLVHARATIQTFLQDTLSQGVIGGAAYMTVHPRAAMEALNILPKYWHAGLVLMNQNCPEYLRNDEVTIEQDLCNLAERFGERSIITDRFAVACSSELRRLGAGVAQRYGLRTQTHLNEQVREKSFVEKTLYPSYKSYTDVYRTDKLLHHRPLLAHCIQMTRDEWSMLADSGSAVMHCPTSNLLLGSGVMKLDELREHAIDYALCTDVGASPTTSMLLEMSQFLLVHENAQASEALYRATLAPAKILNLDKEIGAFAIGKSMSFIEIAVPDAHYATADEAIRDGLLAGDVVSDATRDTVRRLREGQPVESSSLETMTIETNARAARFEQGVSKLIVDGKRLR